MIDLRCPYCETGIKICHDDGFGYSENVAHEMDCWKCEKSFIFHTSISFDFEPSKADCLNGGEHVPYERTIAPKPKVPGIDCRVCERVIQYPQFDYTSA